MIYHGFREISVHHSREGTGGRGSSPLPLAEGQGVKDADRNWGQVNPPVWLNDLCLPDRPHLLQAPQPSKSCYQLRAK